MFTKILFYTLISVTLVRSQPTLDAIQPNAGLPPLNEPHLPLDIAKMNRDERIHHLFTNMGKSIGGAVDESVKSIGGEIESLLGIGDATANAARTIVKAKINRLGLIGKVGNRALTDFRQVHKPQY